jgi:ribosomal protein S18 acetylase RimI-like enzyme
LIAEKQPPAFFATSQNHCVSFLGLWFDNLGHEPCAQVSYWIDAPGDVAVRRWVDANLLDTVVPFAKSQGVSIIRARVAHDDEGRQGALAASGFEQADEVLTLSSQVPRDMSALLMTLGMVWTVSFERVTAKDVIKLHNEAYADDPDVVRVKKASIDLYNTPHSEIWLATVAKKPVGFVELSVHERADGARVGHIDSVAVMPHFREQGIGSELVLWALDRFSHQGVRAASLQVRASNTAALRIYRKIGFVAVARQGIWQLRLAPAPAEKPKLNVTSAARRS